MTADSVEALDRVFDEAERRRNEGLMVKDPRQRVLARAGAAWAG